MILIKIITESTKTTRILHKPVKHTIGMIKLAVMQAQQILWSWTQRHTTQTHRSSQMISDFLLRCSTTLVVNSF